MKKIKIKKSISLAPYTTLGIGGKAKYFFQAENEKEIVYCYQWLKKRKLPCLVLGGGSNVLISDNGFKGLVLLVRVKNENNSYSQIKIKKRNSKFFVSVFAGVGLFSFIHFCQKKGLTGLESLSGIPGTIGGAIYGNAGGKFGFISDYLYQVKFLDDKTGKIIRIKRNQCRFAYRSSYFQKKKGIILSADFIFKKEKKEEIKKRIQQVLLSRKGQPQGKSCGSIFKNPSKNIYAGEVIEKCGLKNKQIGAAIISPKHANWIINLGKAKAEDVLKLIDLCKKRVKEKFSIQLEEEIKIIK